MGKHLARKYKVVSLISNTARKQNHNVTYTGKVTQYRFYKSKKWYVAKLK